MSLPLVLWVFSGVPMGDATLIAYSSEHCEVEPTCPPSPTLDSEMKPFWQGGCRAWAWEHAAVMQGVTLPHHCIHLQGVIRLKTRSCLQMILGGILRPAEATESPPDPTGTWPPCSSRAWRMEAPETTDFNIHSFPYLQGFRE